MSPRTKKKTLDGMKTLAVTGMVLTLGQQWLSIRSQMHQTKVESETVAASVVGVVQDNAKRATRYGAVREELARLKHRVRVLEARIGTAQRVYRRSDTGSPLGPDYMEPPKRGLLSTATGVLGGAVASGWRFLFGS